MPNLDPLRPLPMTKQQIADLVKRAKENGYQAFKGDLWDTQDLRLRYEGATRAGFRRQPRSAG